MEDLSTKRDLKDIETIIDYCGKIDMVMEEFGRDEESFHDNYALQSSCAFSLIQIGESVKNLLKRGFGEKYPAVEWKQIARFRDVIVHHYGKTDISIVWKTSAYLVPELKSECEFIHKRLLTK